MPFSTPSPQIVRAKPQLSITVSHLSWAGVLAPNPPEGLWSCFLVTALPAADSPCIPPHHPPSFAMWFLFGPPISTNPSRMISHTPSKASDPFQSRPETGKLIKNMGGKWHTHADMYAISILIIHLFANIFYLRLWSFPWMWILWLAFCLFYLEKKHTHNDFFSTCNSHFFLVEWCLVPTCKLIWA